MKLALIETMPEHLVASHIAARNWGEYPHNGAERSWVPEGDAEETVAADSHEYARIIKTAEVPFDLGARVETTDAGEDDEAGYLLSYEYPKIVLVGWDSGVRSEIEVSRLSVAS